MGKRRARSWTRQNKIYDNLAVRTFSESSDDDLPPTPPAGPPIPPGLYNNARNGLWTFQNPQEESSSKRTRSDETHPIDRSNIIQPEVDETFLRDEYGFPDDTMY